jgi:hypothetical protein
MAKKVRGKNKKFRRLGKYIGLVRNSVLQMNHKQFAKWLSEETGIVSLCN